MIEGFFQIQKYPGKGGWYYIPIPDIKQDNSNPFGWVIISGKIDGYPFKYKKLMPMGGGKLFFSLNAQLRNKINKSEGDSVHLLLTENPKVVISNEVYDSIRLIDNDLIDKLTALTENERIKYIQPINEASKETNRIKLINKLIDYLINNNH